MTVHTAASPAASAVSIDSESFRNVIGHLASGVTVVTCDNDGMRSGSTASAVSSLSLDPPMLLVCLNRASATSQAIDASGRFAVNILGEHQTHLATHFASRVADKFDGLSVNQGPHGQPLLGDSLAQLECRVSERAIGGTHTVFLAEVESASIRIGEPLTYYRGKFGRFTEASDDQAFSRLRGALLEESNGLGDVFDVDEIVEKLDVPHSSASYALGRLEKVGLVTRAGASTYSRTTIDSALVTRTFDARWALTSGALSTATLALGPDAVAGVNSAADAALIAIDANPDSVGLYLALCSIYGEIARLSGNHILEDLGRRLSYPSLVTALLPDHDRLIVREALARAYATLAECVEARNPSAAADAVREFHAVFRAICLASVASRPIAEI